MVEASLLARPLSPEDLRAQVEATSAALRLEIDAGKGRFLVARRRIEVGEVVLSEQPLFQGTHEGAYSRHAFVQSFLALADEEGAAVDDDCLHPHSSLCDCIAAIVLARRVVGSSVAASNPEKGDRTLLRLRQLASLSRSGTLPMPSDCASSIREELLPDLRDLITEDELVDLLQILNCNRYGSLDGTLDLMFAGSMFEHSCDPNCFVASGWRAPQVASAREYRALRPIQEGEALSVDYMMLPQSYLGMSGRRELLAGWGFSCSCARCTVLPELTRAFVCPACDLPELCPARPAPRNVSVELCCRACNKVAEASYTARCLATESAALQAFSPVVSEVEEAHKELLETEHMLGIFHFAKFQLAFQAWLDGPDFDTDCSVEEIECYTAAVDRVIACLTRWCGSEFHPQLLSVYHARALLAHGDLDAQRCFLDLERAVLSRFYPEEAALQDAEVLHMVLRKGPTSGAKVGEEHEIFQPAPAEDHTGNQPQMHAITDDSPSAVGNWALSDMD